MNPVNFYVCPVCGNIAMLTEDHKVPLFCCGKKMELMNANSTDAAVEKHVPVVSVEGSVVRVSVGGTMHPATEAHHIGWLYLATEQGGQYRKLDPVADPVAEFALAQGEKPVAVYAYCNLHGLWVASV